MGSISTESPHSIDIHGVKRDLDEKHWCIFQCHFTQSSMGARTLNLGGSVFLYTCALGSIENVGDSWNSIIIVKRYCKRYVKSALICD